MGDHRLDHTDRGVREAGHSKIRITALAMAVTGISAAAIGAGAAITGHSAPDGPVQVSIAVAGATGSSGALPPVLTNETDSAAAVGGPPGPIASGGPGQSPTVTAPAAGQPQKPVAPGSPTGKPENIGGQLSCSSGQSVEGVWVTAAAGSGYAPWQGSNDNAAKFWYTLPVSESYSVHIGCGGTPQSWAVSCVGPQVTRADASFECLDVSGAAGYQTCKVT